MRDPLADPRPGDALIYGPQWQRERVDVERRDGPIVAYRYSPTGALLLATIERWKQLMEKAEVIHVGD